MADVKARIDKFHDSAVKLDSFAFGYGLGYRAGRRMGWWQVISGGVIGGLLWAIGRDLVAWLR